MPVVTRTNLCMNPSFEAGITGWTAFGTTPPTLSQSAAQALNRTHSLLITWGTNTSTIQGPQYSMTGLTVGQQYTVSAQVYTPAGGARLVAAVAGIGLGGASSTSAGIWSQVSITFTASTTSHTLQFWTTAGTTSGQLTYLDAVLIEQAPVAASYFDGASSGCQWTGTADLSTSQQLAGPLSISTSVDLVNEPPRVAIFVSGAPGATAQIMRTDPDGAMRPVRGGDPAPLTVGQWIGYDYEMPYGAPTTYTVVPSDGSANAFVATAAVATTQARLIHPGQPSLSIQIRGIKRGDRSYASGAALFEPVGRQYPVVITDGQRKSATYQLTLRTALSVDASAMKAILAGCVPLLLQAVYPFTIASLWHYLSIDNVTEGEVTTRFGDPLRVWTCDVTEVDRPAGGIAAQRTWSDVLAEAGTWSDLMSKYRTWAGVLTGVPGT